MEFSHYSDLFLSESREHISAINHLLLALEGESDAQEPVEGLFRSVHTIKGMAAAMGYPSVADVAHALEHLLDLLRKGQRAADESLLGLLFEAADTLEHSIELAVAGREEELDPAVMLERLRAAAEGGNGGEKTLRVQVRVDAASPLPGVRAFLVLRQARDLGVVAETEPSEDRLQGDGFDGRLSFVLRTARTTEEVREALLSVGELAGVDVGEAGAPTALPKPTAPERTDGSATVERARGRHIRVDPQRLDALLDQVGELVIARDRLQQVAAGVGNEELQEAVHQLSRLIGDMREEIMRTRMVSVRQVFDRFPRLVRDVARSLGKRVDFEVEGKEIELDRLMLDEIGDPLVHLLRNALDHGIEAPEERRAAGKPETGTLRLVASRQRSEVVIRVEDDGRGIQRDRVLGKAVAQGLISPEAADRLPNEEVAYLLTRSGFSTAEQVTDVSGRGVGLDVVATRVRGLGGSFEISSAPGEGTSFILRLPATLAIIRALLVRAGEERYALPLTCVSETAEITGREVHEVGTREIVRFRGETLPLVQLGSVLGSTPQQRDVLLPIVILELGEQRAALAVDELAGQQEIVVKDFDSTADMVHLFSGATILSDGRPALILDGASLFAGLARVAA